MSEQKKDNAIQPGGWQDALPRPEYRAFERLLPETEWYEVYRIRPDTYALYEPGHFQEVICFLAVGKQRALLWDTGMGFAPVRPVVERLTDLPVTVVNSHTHFDHVGGNWEFPQGFAWFSEEGLQATAGADNARMSRALQGDSLAAPLPGGLTADRYVIHPFQLVFLDRLDPDSEQARAIGLVRGELAEQPGWEEALRPLFTGLAFDLGGRRMEVLRVQGHGPDSIMLLDLGRRMLFTGDLVYPAALYAHQVVDGEPVFSAYADTMARLRLLQGRVDHLCCSHNLPLYDAGLLGRVADLFDEIKAGRAVGRHYEDGLVRYQQKDFAIVTQGR